MERTAPHPAGPRRDLSVVIGLLLEPGHLLPGAAALLACAFPLIWAGRLQPPSAWSPRVLAYALVGLAAGATCRALGAQLRRRITRLTRPRGAPHARLRKLLVAHGLATSLQRSGPTDQDPREGGRRSPLMGYSSAPALEQRLWAEVRQEPGLLHSWLQSRRRRSLQALHDGLGAALLVWSAVFLLVPPYVEAWPTGGAASLGVAVAFLLLAVTAWSEAERQEKACLEELVAAVAQRADEELHAAPAPGDAAAPLAGVRDPAPLPNAPA